MLEYNDEVKAKLSEPVPSDQIKTLPSGVKYTTDKYVQDRLDRVVGPDGWSDKYAVTAYAQPLQKLSRKGEVLATWIGTIECSLTVLGVTKSAVYDLEFTDDMYGTPSTNAQATAFKRAAMKHGIARELWKGTEASDAAYPAPPPRSNATAPARATGSVRRSTADSRPFRVPSDATLKWLTDLYVPADIAAGLNGAGTRDDPSQASQIITSLMQIRNADNQGFKSDPMPFVEDALSVYAPDLVPERQGIGVLPASGAKKGRPIRRDDEDNDRV
jgi:hypothetical protein